MAALSRLAAAPALACLLRYACVIVPWMRPWDGHWCTYLANVPSDRIVEDCGTSGSAELSDEADLERLCGLGPEAAACASRSSLASSDWFEECGRRIFSRRRRQNLLVLPQDSRNATCQHLESSRTGADIGAAPFVNVVVMHDFDNGCRFNLHSEWVASVLLPSFGRPLRVIQSELREDQSVLDRPMLNNSLVVVIAFHEVRFSIGEYGALARLRGVQRMGLLHLDHEVTWDLVAREGADPLENLAHSHVSNSHYVKDYVHFDFVIRTYYSPLYAQASTYVPLGTVSIYLDTAAPLLGDVPPASGRAVRCLAALGGSFGSVQHSYRMDRQALRQVLEQHPGLCTLGRSRGSAYREELRRAAISLCPFGTQEETARVWESALAGALVVLTRAVFVQHELKAPFVMLESWSELPSLLERFRVDPAALDSAQQKQQAWLAQYIPEVKARIRALGDRTYFGPSHGGLTL